MEKVDIKHLGELSRIALTEAEIAALETEIPAILEYVSMVNSIAADGATTKQVGARYNVFRDDEVTTEPGSNTEALLGEAPNRDGQFLKVKKILQQD